MSIDISVMRGLTFSEDSRIDLFFGDCLALLLSVFGEGTVEYWFCVTEGGVNGFYLVLEFVLSC